MAAWGQWVLMRPQERIRALYLARDSAVRSAHVSHWIVGPGGPSSADGPHLAVRQTGCNDAPGLPGPERLTGQTRLATSLQKPRRHWAAGVSPRVFQGL